MWNDVTETILEQCNLSKTYDHLKMLFSIGVFNMSFLWISAKLENLENLKKIFKVITSK